MICKNCGTESKGRYCSYCGASFFEEAPTVEPEMPEEIVSVEPPTATEKNEKNEKNEKKKKKDKFSKQEVTLSKVLWPAMAMLLPLIYFFVDVFIRLPDLLFQTNASGKSLLHVFIERLSSSEFALNTVQEIKTITFGTDTELFQPLSYDTIWVAGDMQIPLFIVFGLALASALFAILTIFSGGKLLTKRIFLDLSAFVGYGAAFAPLIGLAYYRIFALVWYGVGSAGMDYADHSMQSVLLSIESLLLIGVLLCIMIPCVSTLRRVGARARDERVHIALPYRMLSGRSFNFTRVQALLFVLATVALVVVQHGYPLWVSGKLFDVWGLWNDVYADYSQLYTAAWHIFVARNTATGVPLFASALTDLVSVAQIALILLVLITLIPPVLRVMFANSTYLARKKWACRSISRIGVRTRRMVLMPFVCFTLVQTLFTLALLFASGLWIHLDLSDVRSTLSLLYLLIGMVRAQCATNTLFSLWAIAGVFLAHLAGNMSCKLIFLSHLEQKEN